MRLSKEALKKIDRISELDSLIEVAKFLFKNWEDLTSFSIEIGTDFYDDTDYTRNTYLVPRKAYGSQVTKKEVIAALWTWRENCNINLEDMPVGLHVYERTNSGTVSVSVRPVYKDKIVERAVYGLLAGCELFTPNVALKRSLISASDYEIINQKLSVGWRVYDTNKINTAIVRFHDWQVGFRSTDLYVLSAEKRTYKLVSGKLLLVKNDYE